MRSLLRKPFRVLYYAVYGKDGRQVIINKEKYRVSAHIARGVNSVNDETPYKILRNLCNNADVVFDIGANVGIISILLAKSMLPGSRIYSFEPLPSTFKKLADTARVQNGNARIIPFNFAMSNAIGSVHFTDKEDPTENNILTQPEAGSVLVKATTVDAFCAEHNVVPQVVKVDVEGAEFFVLEGMVKTLQQNDCIVLVEIHRDMLRDFGVDRQKFTALLEKIGGYLYNSSGNKIAYDEILTTASPVILSRKELDRSNFLVG